MTFPAVLWMRRLIGTFRPDIVHAHWMPFGALAAIAGAGPLVVTAWGSDVYSKGRRRLLEARLALWRSSLATADSAHLLERLKELGPASLSTALVNWGVNLESFRTPAEGERASLKADFGLGPGPLIFSPRGLRQIYNPAIVVEAFKRVRATIPDAQLMLKSAAVDEPSAGSWEGEQGVHVIGAVDYADMAKLFRAAEVTVSIAASDSSPRSVWEAMAAGSATILSDLPWVHELISDGQEALVVEPSTDTVAAAITRLLTSDQERQTMATGARTLVERYRNRDAELCKLETLYHEVVQSGPRRSGFRSTR